MRTEKKIISDNQNLKKCFDDGKNIHKGEENGRYNGGNRTYGMYPCPICVADRRCEKRNAWRKCWECHVNRPPNFSQKEWHKKTKEKAKKWAMEYLGGKCVRCSSSDLPSCCYQFHHLNPLIKEDNIGRLLRQNPSDKLKKELDKCIILCANCHAIIHHIEEQLATNLTGLTYA